MERGPITVLSFGVLVLAALSACAGLTGSTDGGIPLCPNQPTACPDLAPVVIRQEKDLSEGAPCAFCRLFEKDGKRVMEVSVRNQGGIGFHRDTSAPQGSITLGNPVASASTTRITFSPPGGVPTTIEVPTPQLPVGFSVDLKPVEVPQECLNQDCHVTLMVDAKEIIAESNERNNTVSCFLPFVR